MDNAERALKAILYRHNCPSKAELGEYDFGFLDSSRSAAISKHLETCPLCQTDLVQMRRFMALPVAENVLDQANGQAKERVSLVERIKIVVVDLLTPPEGLLIPSAFQPVLRGELDNMATQVFHVDEYIVALSAMKGPNAWQKQDIIGDILPTADSAEEFHYWNTYLWRGGKLLATSPVDQDNSFLFEDIQIDQKPHDLILSGPRIEILLQNLRIS